MSSQAPETNVPQLMTKWCDRLRRGIDLVANKPLPKEPFKFIYEALQSARNTRAEIVSWLELELNHDLELVFWVKLALVHCYSCIAKWNEACDQLGESDQEHRLCINLIEEVLKLQSLLPDSEPKHSEVQYGFRRVRYMLLYELTRFAILCSERDLQEKALELLKKAEEFYHSECQDDVDVEIDPTSKEDWPMLKEFDGLNSEKSSDMFVYVLFYLGQAYQITDNKEMAILYLQMVLRKQLESKSTSVTTWASDTIKMSTAVLLNVQSFQACKTLLVAATTVLTNDPGQDRLAEEYKQTWADLGRSWIKLGLEILDASCDRLKDLEQQIRKPLKFKDTLEFTQFEKQSLELDPDTIQFDTLILINSFTFPNLDVTDSMKTEMPARYARDFDEARGIFLPLQRWYRIATEYYVIDEFASDYIEIVTDYAASYKYLVFFEPNVERQITMLKRRLSLLEDVLKPLNPVAFYDLFHYILKDLAEVYETIYKLKVARARDRGEGLRPKDKKLVTLLAQALIAHKRNLDIFKFDLRTPTKQYPEPYEKAVLGIVLCVGRIMGSISHDHSLHPDAVQYALDGKEYYEYFLSYLNLHTNLKSDFQILFDGAVDMPELLEAQAARIKQRVQSRT